MINKTSIKKNAIYNIIKQASSALFPMVVFSYVSHVIGAANFGKINYTRSIVNYFYMLASLGINSYAIREGARLRNDKRKLDEFVSEIFSINVIISIISVICLLGLTFWWSKLNSYFELIMIQSGIIILTAIGSDWINSIFEDFRYLAIRYVLVQIVGMIFIFFLVKEPEDYLKYALVLVLSGYGGNLLNIRYIKRYSKRKFTFKCNFKKHIVPMLTLFLGTVSIYIYLNSDVTMMGVILGDFDTGIYSAVSKIYTVTKEMVNAITIVMIPRISSLIYKNDINEVKNISTKTIDLLMTLVLPIATGLFWASKDIILLVNGDEYIIGYTSLRIFSIALPLAVLSCFFSNAILISFRKEKKYVIATVVAAVLNIVLNIYAIPMFGMEGAAATTLMSEVVVMVLTYLFVRKEITFKINIKDMIANIVGCALICIVYFFLRNVSNSINRLFLFGVISIIVYGGTIFISKNEVISGVINR